MRYSPQFGLDFVLIAFFRVADKRRGIPPKKRKQGEGGD